MPTRPRTIHRLLIALTAISLATAGLAAQPVLEDVQTASGSIDVLPRPIEIDLPPTDATGPGTMGAFAYLAEGRPDRPVTFFWNGGPGASAALLHAGFAGPLVASIDDDGNLTPVPNPLTLIDRTDLVYVDPVGTGFSRADDANAFWGVDEDAEAAAEFVRTFLEDHDLADRPVYLCGESYGAIRVASMLEPLRDRGIEPAGLILISPALDTRLLGARRGGRAARYLRADLLPTIAALHAGHTDHAPDLAAFLDDACAFAHGPYLDALTSTDDFDEDELDTLRRERDRFTGGRELRRVRTQDPHDARFRAAEGAMSGIEVEALRGAVRAILEDVHAIDATDGYVMLNRGAHGAWRGRDGSTPVFQTTISTARLIADATQDAESPPRIFIAGGWYDLVTLFATNRRLASDGAFGACEVTVRDYPGGHVIYADPHAHELLAADVRAWLPGRPTDRITE